MGKTSIEWCDVSWPVVNGCRRISPGCGGASGDGGCYAERLISTRLSKTPKYGGLAVFKPGRGPQWTGETRLWEPSLDEPLRLKTPSKIFVADMGDLFYEGVHVDDIRAVFGVMILAPWHTYQVLTKRAHRMRVEITQLAEMGAERAIETCLDALARRSHFAMPKHTAELARAAYARHGLDHRQAAPWPLPWVWLGVSVENQRYADERIPELLDTPAALRFISYEPALGPIDLGKWIGPKSICHRCNDEHVGVVPGDCPGCSTDNLITVWGDGQAERLRSGERNDTDRKGPPLDWVIVGGESGPGARIFDAANARAVVEQGRAAGVGVFVKQMGRNAIDSDYGLAPLTLKHPKGSDMEEWRDDLRVREWPAGATP